MLLITCNLLETIYSEAMFKYSPTTLHPCATYACFSPLFQLQLFSWKQKARTGFFQRKTLVQGLNGDMNLLSYTKYTASSQRIICCILGEGGYTYHKCVTCGSFFRWKLLYVQRSCSFVWRKDGVDATIFLSGRRYEPLASSKCLFIVFNDKDAFTFWEVVGQTGTILPY